MPECECGCGEETESSLYADTGTLAREAFDLIDIVVENTRSEDVRRQARAASTAIQKLAAYVGKPIE